VIGVQWSEKREEIVKGAGGEVVSKGRPKQQREHVAHSAGVCTPPRSNAPLA